MKGLYTKPSRDPERQVISSCVDNSTTNVQLLIQLYSRHQNLSLHPIPMLFPILYNIQDLYGPSTYYRRPSYHSKADSKQNADYTRKDYET